MRQKWVVAVVSSVAFVDPQAVYACSRSSPVSPAQMVAQADLIVRVRAITYQLEPKGDMITNSEPDSRVLFNVLEVVKGSLAPLELTLPGYLSDSDDFNENPVPYTFVRKNGRSGMCFANTYRRGAEHLLVLKKRAPGNYTPNWYALGPTNEQLRPALDPWLAWVKREVASPSGKTTARPNNGLHQTGRGGAVASRPVVEARPAGEAECSTPSRTASKTVQNWARALLLLGMMPGVVQAAVGQTPQATTKPACLRIAAAEGGPKKVSGKNPQLSERARSIKTTGGPLIYDVTIDEEGRVRNPQLVRPIRNEEPWPEIEKAWRSALAEWKYEPVLINGKPVTVCMTIAVTIHVR